MRQLHTTPFPRLEVVIDNNDIFASIFNLKICSSKFNLTTRILLLLLPAYKNIILDVLWSIV